MLEVHAPRGGPGGINMANEPTSAVCITHSPEAIKGRRETAVLQRIREIHTTKSENVANALLNSGWALLLINQSGDTIEYVLGRLHEPARDHC